MNLVSILVPVQNQEKYIHECLYSLIHQHYENIEIIVIDDNSTDATRKIAQSFSGGKVRVIDGLGKGIASCLNTGLAEAAGEIIMRCDADDRYPEDRVGKQVDWLMSHPDFGAVCGAYYSIDQKGKIVSRVASFATENEISDELRRGITRTSLCTFALRAYAMKKVGEFRKYFHTSEDIDFMLRFCETSRVFYLPDFTYYYRIHDSSITHSQSSPVRQFYETTARLFQEQRSQRGYDDLQAGAPPNPPCSIFAKADSAHQHIQGLLTGEAWRMHKAGRKKDALKAGMQLVKNNPFNLATWRQCLLLLLKRPN